MLLGQYTIKVDDKGRIAVPKRLREEMGTKVVVTQGYENCLLLVSQDKWENLIQDVMDKPFSSGGGRDVRRFLLGGAFEVELDGQGRFVIPAALQNYGEIEDGAVCVGMGNYVEVWGTSRWADYQEYLDEHIETIAEKITE